MKKLYFYALMLGIVLSGCSKNDDDGDGDAQQFDCSNPNIITQQYLDAANAFLNNPTEDSCNDLREEAIEFLEAIEQCNIAVGTDVEALIQEYQDLDCSDFAG
ncbi:hypothetical protein GCM10009117_13970 [Gangjinia marincola]|uniref:Uncharacterized protein n=1 Tax=Gangjinia marincola TaxID=578463 RepID=A0ABN1MGF5_9FLAO